MTMEKWEFDFGLSEAVDCEKVVAGRENIIFQTEKRHKEQNQVVGFKIVVEAKNFVLAEKTARQRAVRLARLLSASSGTWTDYYLDCYRQLTGQMKTIGISVQSSYQIRNNAILNMCDEKFSELIEGKEDESIPKIKFVSDAIQSAKSGDYAGVIKNLFLANCEKDKKEFKGLRHLRHALSHNKGPLKENIVNNLDKHFSGTFKLRGAGSGKYKFNHDSEQNRRNVKCQAKKFLTTMHEQLRRDLGCCVKR